MPLFEAYENRRLLVTGTTGFLGKVLLEKLLYTLPTVKCIYVLIRAKKGSKLNERFKR
jgi:fatty acyl-CoA reductase